VNNLPRDKQIDIIAALTEGMSIRAVERLTGVHRDTIMRLGVRVGQGCTTLLDAKMRNLSCTRLEMDEIWGFVGKKERHMRPGDDPQFGNVWTYCAIDADTKLIYICNPNNPTGYLYSAAEMEILKQIIIKHNLYLFADEAYREFCYEGTHTSAMHLKGAEDNVVLMDTISKRYSACGGRIGAFVTKNTALLAATMKFAQARLSPPSFAQILGEAAVDLPDDYFDTTKAEYKQRRDAIVARLNATEGDFCPSPGGAFYAMAKLPIDDCDKFCQWLLEDFSYNGHTVMLAPATGFYGTAGLGKQEVRLAYVLNTESINNAMDCLEKALQEYPGKII